MLTIISADAIMKYFYSFSRKIGIDIQCNLSPKPLKGPFGLTQSVNFSDC